MPPIAKVLGSVMFVAIVAAGILMVRDLVRHARIRRQLEAEADRIAGASAADVDAAYLRELGRSADA